MRLSLLFSLIIMITLGCAMDPNYSEMRYKCIKSIPVNDPNHPDNAKYQQLLDNITSSGVPGIMMSVRDEINGTWSSATGKADLSSDVDMQPCHITRVGSTVKTFTAVTILLLQEEGKLNLNDKVTQYLSERYLRDLDNADEVTIRQLLQHTSGIYNYIQNIHFQTASLNNLIKEWKPKELLSYARNQPAYFSPGEDVRYSNTNYILLGEIIEVVEQKPFYEVFEEKIFKPLDLSFTSFAAKDPVPEGIVQGYIDMYSKLNVVNATYYSGWDYYTADGGLISNAYDLNRFLTALFNGKLLSEESLNEMTNWRAPLEQDLEGFKTSFGLGIFKIKTDYGPAYIHSGDAIGYFASMVYFPNQQITITWAANGNYGLIDQFVQGKNAMENIFNVVLGE